MPEEVLSALSDDEFDPRLLLSIEGRSRVDVLACSDRFEPDELLGLRLMSGGGEWDASLEELKDLGLPLVDGSHFASLLPFAPPLRPVEEEAVDAVVSAEPRRPDMDG